MDLEEWELLSDEGFIDLHEVDGGNNFPPISNPSTTIIDMNYFQSFVEPQKNKNQKNSGVIPVQIQFDEEGKTMEIPEEVIKLPIESEKPENHQIKEADDHQETISQVFFKKLKENEFVDMKMDSPKSLNRGIMAQIDVGTYQFEKTDGNFDEEHEQEQEIPIKKEKESSKNTTMEEVSANWEDDNNRGLNIWKWAMTGIGALFSFGFAAAAVSIIVLGNRHKQSCNHSKKQELHFQIYSHDKRLKQVVRRATKLNEAITVMRGAPLTRAHITIGGYYEGL